MENLNHALFLLLNAPEQPNVLLPVIANTIHPLRFGRFMALGWVRK